MKEERYLEDGFNGFVEELINYSRIEDIELGIAKRMLAKGYDSLSDKQKYVFDKAIEKNAVDKCQRCDIDILWREMLEALDNGGYCNYCHHMMEKINNECIYKGGYHTSLIFFEKRLLNDFFFKQ